MHCFNCLHYIVHCFVCMELHQLYLLCLCRVLFSTSYSLPPLANPLWSQCVIFYSKKCWIGPLNDNSLEEETATFLTLFLLYKAIWTEDAMKILLLIDWATTSGKWWQFSRNAILSQNKVSKKVLLYWHCHYFWLIWVPVFWIL